MQLPALYCIQQSVSGLSGSVYFWIPPAPQDDLQTADDRSSNTDAAASAAVVAHRPGTKDAVGSSSRRPESTSWPVGCVWLTQLAAGPAACTPTASILTAQLQDYSPALTPSWSVSQARICTCVLGGAECDYHWQVASTQLGGGAW